jgi:hypothetical protein
MDLVKSTNGDEGCRVYEGYNRGFEYSASLFLPSKIQLQLLPRYFLP